MRVFIILICITLIFGHFLLESGALLQKYNDFRPVYINPFRSPDYQWYDPKGISIYHWVQMNCVEFLWCATFFILAKVAYKYSFKLFLVGCVFFIYHVADWFMLWWDYKTSNLFYYFLNGAILIAVIMVFIPEKKQAIIKSFD